jgi:hypothetical protein
MKRAHRSSLRRRYGRSTGAVCPEGSRVQALLFQKDRFSLAQAKAWAKRHEWKAGDVDETQDFIHLRQEDPSRFERIRTVFFGGSGVQARVGWPVC